MLKRFLPFLLLISSFSVAEAQVTKTNAAQLAKAKEHYKAGIQFRNNSQLFEAFTEFKKAIELNKKFDSAYVEIAGIYFKSGKMDTAVINFRNAISINPKYSEAYFGLGKIYRDAESFKQFDTAIYYFNLAAKFDPTNKEIYYGLAWIYNARKQHEQAIPYAIKSLEIDNNYRPAYGELGYAYNFTKKYAECIEQFKKNLAVSVVDLAHLYSGLAYIELKNREGAMQQYEALLKVNEKMAGSLKKRIDAMTVIVPAPGGN